MASATRTRVGELTAPLRNPDWRGHDYTYSGFEEYYRPNVATADLLKAAEIGKYLFCEAIWLADDQDNTEFFTEAFSFYGPLATAAMEEMGLSDRSTDDGQRVS